MSLASLLAIPPVKKFLQDGDAYADLAAVVEKNEFPTERTSEILDLTDAVLEGQLEMREIPSMLQEAFGISEEQAQKVAADVVGVRLLPLEAFVPGARDQLVAWGADPASYPQREVGKEALTIDQFASRMADRADLSFSDLLMKRLSFLLEQRMSNQKNDESLRTFFGRPLTIGGLGLAKEQIDTLMRAVSDALPGIRLVAEEEKAKIVPQVGDAEPASPSQDFLPEIAPSHEVAAEVPVISSPIRSASQLLAKNTEETPDIQSQKKAEKVKRLYDDAMKGAFSEAIDAGLARAQTTLHEVGIPSSAFADLLGKMLRGIRDQYQTRDILEKDYKAKGAALSVLLDALLGAQDAYRIATDALRQVDALGNELSEKEAQTVEEEEAKLAEEKFAHLTKNTPKPAPAIVELTVGSVPPPQQDVGQKKVADVVSGNRLMGPVEQLGTLSLADFRRLSTNPDEAVRKMEALLLALEKTSYEDRVRGLLAWRKSPLALLHVALMTESLNTGVAIAEIAARRRSQGQESLGPAEMQALAKWNEKMRF